MESFFFGVYSRELTARRSLNVNAVKLRTRANCVRQPINSIRRVHVLKKKTLCVEVSCVYVRVISLGSERMDRQLGMLSVFIGGEEHFA